ncbi:hypothetical protein DFQ29_008791 [Apophysomyces sp. BC1021]|nr:hypothetical protein DFQ29_008791 [Apophysomyces sp. BC1021]
MCLLSDLSKKEEEVVCMIANFLRPFAPTSEFADVRKPPILYMPFVVLGNAILRATGYSNFVRRICPEVGLSDIHVVALDEAAMYETLCCRTTGAQFSVRDAGLQPITSISAARKNKERMLFSFFDEDRINGVCAAYGLEFRHRVFITTQNIAILDGNVVRKCSVVSAYDE